jgi:hypothetical protein
MKTLGDLRHTCLNKHTRTSYHEEKNVSIRKLRKWSHRSAKIRWIWDYYRSDITAPAAYHRLKQRI